MSYQVGRGGMLEGLDEVLVGMSAGDEGSFTSQLVGGDLVGQDVEVPVVSPGPGAGAPGLDDEFAQTASEFDTVDDLRPTFVSGSAAASSWSRPLPPATRSSRSCSTRSRFAARDRRRRGAQRAQAATSSSSSRTPG